MIELEITNSPDPEILGPRIFYKNQIYLGKSRGDILIQHNEMQNNMFMLEVLPQECLIHPGRDVSYYLINGKRATSIGSIHPGMTVSFLGMTLKLIKFSYSSIPTKKELLNRTLEKLINENSPKLKILKLISENFEK